MQDTESKGRNSKEEEGCEQRQSTENAESWQEQYKAFGNLIHRGEFIKAITVWRDEFCQFPDVTVFLNKLSQYKPSKIIIEAVRDRGSKRILQLHVPPKITHIGVKYSNSDNNVIYSVAELKNMLEVQNNCRGLSMFGIIRIADRELIGDVTIHSFTQQHTLQEIQFSVAWPKRLSLFSSKTLRIKIKNTASHTIHIPKTLLVGDKSLAIPFNSSHGKVLTEIGPNTLEPQQEMSWEYSMKDIKGDFSVNLFAKDDPYISYKPASGVSLSHSL